MHNFLTFSDSAKFADIARNLVNGAGYGNNFTFWGSAVFDYLKLNIFPSSSVPPVMPFSIAAFFKIFGVTDLAVIATSVFYFILALFFVFLLAKKIFKSNLVGILSTLAVGFNYDMINYASSGASESPFIFEIVAASYFASIKKKWANVATISFLILMYFTRPQAFIYIAGIILYWLLNNFKVKKASICFIFILIAGILVDRLILLPQSGKMFLYSITGRGINSALSQSYSTTASDALRGITESSSGGAVQIAKNIFYNLYNFFKLMPQIISPYLIALFIIGLFRRSQDKIESSFKVASIFMFAVTLLVAAVSIPFFRYLHPVVPIVYIIAIATMMEILKSQISNSKLLVICSFVLVLLFGVGQTLGVLVLDSRFVRNTRNIGKPPVYVELSKILKENTNKNELIVTNLDTWGSWYGERKTVWFPVEPGQLIDKNLPAGRQVPFDAIYLTSYLIDDANYYMGNDWRTIFENPNDQNKWKCEGCSEIAKEFKLGGMYKILASDDHEKQNASAVLLIKK